MKLIPFDLEKAKAGHPVITRDGRDARIVCWDLKGSGEFLLLVLVRDGAGESSMRVSLSGNYLLNNEESPYDLFMKPVKKTYWVNIYRSPALPNFRIDAFGNNVFKREQFAKNSIIENGEYYSTVPIEIEE